MTILHWSPPDTRGDILAEALRAGAAEPVAVHVRPELFARLGPVPLREVTGLPTIPLVVDDQLPRVPGYEVHRAAPPLPTPRPVVDATPGPPAAVPCTGRSRRAGRRRDPRSRDLRRFQEHALA
jgi:hypothetical protein